MCDGNCFQTRWLNKKNIARFIKAKNEPGIKYLLDFLLNIETQNNTQENGLQNILINIFRGHIAVNIVKLIKESSTEKINMAKELSEFKKTFKSENYKSFDDFATAISKYRDKYVAHSDYKNLFSHSTNDVVTPYFKDCENIFEYIITYLMNHGKKSYKQNLYRAEIQCFACFKSIMTNDFKKGLTNLVKLHFN